MGQKLLIGFTGKAGHGKSTAAKVLINEYDFIRTRFADKLKRMMKALGLTDGQVDGDQKDIPSPLLGGATPRWAMQTLGTDWGRKMIFQNIWVVATMYGILRMPDRVVIDDVRFLNEAQAIKEAGGTVIRVVKLGDKAEPCTHSSETEMDLIIPDFTIQAPDNSIPEVEQLTRNVLSELNITTAKERAKEHQKAKEQSANG